MNKELEEMTKSYCDRTTECTKCDRRYKCDLPEICEAIYDAGYRKIEQNEAFMTSPIGDLPINGDGLRKAVDEITRLNNEIAKLTEDRDKCIKTLEDNYTFKTTQNGLCDVFEIVRRVAVKEFAKKLKKKSFNEYQVDMKILDETEIDNLLKEMGANK